MSDTVLGSCRPIEAKDLIALVIWNLPPVTIPKRLTKIKMNEGCPVCGSPTCNCGENCRCTEEFCCSNATSLLQSLHSKKSPKRAGGCCATKRPESSVGETSGHQWDPLAAMAQPPNERGGGEYSPLAGVHKTADLNIDGMTCNGCTSTIETALQNLEGIREVRISLEDQSAVVEWEEPPVNLTEIADTIESAGYHVRTMRERVQKEVPDDEEAHAQRGPSGDDDVQKATLAISGMTCSMCSQAVSRAVEGLNGVDSIMVALSTDSAVINYHTEQVTIDAIREAIGDIGYEVENVEMDNPREGQESSGDHGTPSAETVEERWQRLAKRQKRKVEERRRAFFWSFAGAFPILLFSMILPHFVSWGFSGKEVTVAGRTFVLEGLLFWLLATPVQFLSGWDFYRMTFYNLRIGTAGMDVLVALGTTASYGYACWGLWKNDLESTHFFETSATLICFILAGKWMQASAVRRTSKALTELMKLQSPTAVKVTPGSQVEHPEMFNPLEDHYREETVPINQVHEGDLVKIIRGSSIPADGRIAFGEMSVDESMVTGESMPVVKTPGSDVLGGTVCVETSHEGSGAVFMEVTGVGADTALSQIIELVQDAQTRSVPIQSFADSVSAVFVPTVCCFSLLTYMIWYALCMSGVVPASWYEDLDEGPVTFSLTFGIACLVISCPCALGLATPTAVMVGSGTGARLGVLMKGGEALEVASKVDSVVLDKTGTLTKGQPVIVDCRQFDKIVDNKSLLWMLGSLEKNSEHPLAQAVVSYAEEMLGTDYLEEKPFAQPKSFKALTGRGALGVLNGYSVAVGNRPFASESGIGIPDDAENYMEILEREGKTAVLVAVDGTVCMVMGIADRLKSDATASVAFLRDKMKMDVWMVTGDNRNTARAIARQLGLPEDRVISEALPAAKVQQVRRLQAQDRIVAMVGDGINDSPALAQSDVGISLGSGAKIATEASDMVLVRGNVSDVCTALHLSRSIFRRIQLNLLFSLLYNILGIPIAAGIFYPLVQSRLPPTLAGLAMALSSVSVVLSSLTLRFYRPPSVTRRPSSVTAWAREMEQRNRSAEENELRENLLVNDHLAGSDFTETTALVDNRSSHNGNNDNVV